MLCLFCRKHTFTPVDGWINCLHCNRSHRVESMAGKWGDFIIDPGHDSLLQVRDAEDQQLLIRIEPPYRVDGEVDATPGIWISYQEAFEQRATDPVLLSPETWEQLRDAIDRKLAEWKRSLEDPLEIP